MRKFTENLKQTEISSERIVSINSELGAILTNIEQSLYEVRNIQSEVDTYREVENVSKNDQLDDSYIKMLEIINNFEETIAKIGTIQSNLDDYNNNGRQYLY